MTGEGERVEKAKADTQKEFSHMTTPLPLRCRLGWHKWGRWSNLKKGKQAYHRDYQRRHCLLCGYVKERLV